MFTPSTGGWTLRRLRSIWNGRDAGMCGFLDSKVLLKTTFWIFWEFESKHLICIITLRPSKTNQGHFWREHWKSGNFHNHKTLLQNIAFSETPWVGAKPLPTFHCSVHGSYEHFAIASIVMTEDTLRVLGKQEKPTAKQTARIPKPITSCYEMLVSATLTSRTWETSNAISGHFEQFSLASSLPTPMNLAASTSGKVGETWENTERYVRT